MPKARILREISAAKWTTEFMGDGRILRRQRLRGTGELPDCKIREATTNQKEAQGENWSG